VAPPRRPRPPRRAASLHVSRPARPAAAAPAGPSPAAGPPPPPRAMPAPAMPGPRSAPRLGPRLGAAGGWRSSWSPSSPSACSRRRGSRSGRAARPAVTTSPTAAPTGNDADVALIEEAWRAIEDNYVDAKHLDGRELAYGAIRGLTDAVGDDGHTAFLTAEEAKAVDDSLSGTFVGIGVQVSTETEEVIVGSVFPGTPAEEAGLRRGDRIVAVDGTTTEGETLDEVVARVRGPEGESVTLTIRRAGSPTSTSRSSGAHRPAAGHLGDWCRVASRLRPTRSSSRPGDEGDEVRPRAGRVPTERTALVLDVRANPGGYVNEGHRITSQFVGDGRRTARSTAAGPRRTCPSSRAARGPTSRSWCSPTATRRAPPRS